MTKATMFVATHYPMSVEDPEQGCPPEVYAVSTDKQKLIDTIVAEMNEMTAEEDGEEGSAYGSVKVEEEHGTVAIKASFPWDDTDFSTYYIIESAPVIG